MEKNMNTTQENNNEINSQNFSPVDKKPDNNKKLFSP